MDATRHPITREPLSLPHAAIGTTSRVEDLEQNGNWYVAGEMYRAVLRDHGTAIDAENRARLLARAATAFEIAGQTVAAARAYAGAAGELLNAKHRLHNSGELFNRAARLFRASGEYFSAGSNWRNAGLAFASMPEDSVVSEDNLPPVPSSGGKFSVAGACYEAGGDAYSLTGENAKWACLAYWEAGRAYSQQHRGHHAFIA